MQRVLIIGVGNEVRGDDAIGLLAARDLASLKLPWVRVEESRGDGARLLSLWRGVEAVLIIDAVSSGSPPGTLHRVDVTTFPIPGSFRCASSHDFGVVEAIETARALGELPGECVLYGVEVGETTVGHPSFVYADVRHALLRAIRAELSGWNPSLSVEPT